MTEPTPADVKAATDKAKAAKVGKLDVVDYPHADSILGREHRAVGVVVEVRDGVAVVVPLAQHYVQVDLADVVVLSPDDV